MCWLVRKRSFTDNQNLIVKQLRKCGVSVAITSMVGKGFVDIVCGFRGRNYLIELKDGNKSASRKQLTPDEKTFHDTWNGQINKAESFTEIATIIGL